MVSSSPNRRSPAAIAQTTIGSAMRYRLMPHAFITTSSLFFVSTPMVTNAATSTASGMTK
jgi:hypothetical protein